MLFVANNQGDSEDTNVGRFLKQEELYHIDVHFNVDRVIDGYLCIEPSAGDNNIFPWGRELTALNQTLASDIHFSTSMLLSRAIEFQC